MGALNELGVTPYRYLDAMIQLFTNGSRLKDACTQINIRLYRPLQLYYVYFESWPALQSSPKSLARVDELLVQCLLVNIFTLLWNTKVDSMAMLNIASKANQATFVPALLIATHANESDPNAAILVQFKEVDSLVSGDTASAELSLGTDSPVYGSKNIISKLTEAYPIIQGKNETVVSHYINLCIFHVLIFIQVNEWLDRTSSFYPTDFKSVEGPLLELDLHLTLRSYIVGYTLTIADLSVWGAIRGNKAGYAAVKKGSIVNVSRWFKFIEETNPWIATAVQSMNAAAQDKKATKSREGASYDIALPDTEKGVVTRFPPEPS